MIFLQNLLHAAIEKILGLIPCRGRASAQTKSANRLIALKDSSWPIVLEWLKSAMTDVEVLPAHSFQAARALAELQMTTRSPMGAIVHESGGMLVDSGWLRILGSGGERLRRSLPQWNKQLFPDLYQDFGPGALLLVADDVLGGLFAVNGGAFGKNSHVYYFAPDSLAWESLAIGYSDFIQWSVSGKLETFYADFRWHGWQKDTKNISPDQTFSFYPPLFTKADSLEDRSRKAVSAYEAAQLQFSFQRQLKKQT
jgi:hypothetical protein